MLIITARTWAMIDAVGEVCDCGDIVENGYGQAGVHFSLDVLPS